jgi:hypothetical protein
MRPDPSVDLSDSVVTALRSMLLDHLSGQLVKSLDGAGIESILLRGPSIARHLYTRGEQRPYVDVDLLVPPDHTTAAGDILESHGFVFIDPIGRTKDDRPAWSQTWFRDADAVSVDLHRTLVGASGGAATTWSVLRRHTQDLQLSGTTVYGLDAEATAAVVALHAAQHGVGTERTLADLAHALASFSLETWDAATSVAAELEATPAFATGLRLLPAGAELAERLRLPQATTAEIALRASTPPPTALGFEWLAQRQGVRAKLVFLAGKVVPPEEFMQAWSPRARAGGKTRLVLAYLWRPLWLIGHAGPGLRAWLVARREVRGSGAAR